MKRLKPWHWVLIALWIAGIIVGIGFIPVEEDSYTYSYECIKQRPYPCTVTETKEFTYSPWGSSAYEDWGLFAGCKVTEVVSVRNTDTEGGTFTVRFHCQYGGQWWYIDKSKYIGPWEHATFSAGFDIGCGEPWTWKEPTVIAKTRTVTRESTCYESYTDICYSTVKETERLFWR